MEKIEVCERERKSENKGRIKRAYKRKVERSSG